MEYYNQEQLVNMGFKKVGKNARISCKASIYGAEKMQIGDNSKVDDFVILSGNITIGRNVHIASSCKVGGGNKGIVFEDFSGLAYGVQVFTQTDDYSGETMTNPTIPSKYKKVTERDILIGKHVIVGVLSVIMPGVHLNEGTSVGAMSLVRKSTKEWSIYLGNPAKRIKSRSKNLLKLEAEFLKNEN